MGQLETTIAPLLPTPWLASTEPVLYRRALSARRFKLVNFLKRLRKKMKGPTSSIVNDFFFSMSLPWSYPPHYPRELEVRVPALQNVCEALEWLLRPVDGQAPPSLLGVDVETGPMRETQLLQLSTASRAVIIRIPSLIHPSTGSEAICQCRP